MELRADLYDALLAAGQGQPYRWEFLVANMDWESAGFTAEIGDCALTKPGLLELYRVAGLDAVKRTGCSLGYQQQNVVNLTPAFGPAEAFDLRLGLRWGADYLAQGYRRYAGDERLATAAYQGPARTAAEGWRWTAQRANWVVARADALAAEGITRTGGAGGTAPTPAPPATTGPRVDVALARVELRGPA